MLVAPAVALALLAFLALFLGEINFAGAPAALADAAFGALVASFVESAGGAGAAAAFNPFRWLMVQSGFAAFAPSAQ